MQGLKRGWVVVLAALAAACNGGGKGADGSLAVSISGLGSAPGDVTVTGPSNFSQHLTATQTLSVAPGTYSIAANGVRVSGSLVDQYADVQMSSASVAVTAGKTASVTAAYAVRPGTGLFWIPAPTPGSIAGYSPQALGVGTKSGGGTLLFDAGAPVADVTLSLLLADGGALRGPELVAFDRSGRLWASVNNEGSGVEELVAYSPSQLADSGAPTPTVVISPVTVDAGVAVLSISFPEAMAFDSSGDLWVANQGSSSSVVRFASATIAASGAPVPTLVWNTGTGPVTGIDGLAFDALGNLWVAAQGTPGIYEYTRAQLASATPPTPTVSIANGAGAYTRPENIAFDSAGTLWATECGSFRGVVGYPKGQLMDGGWTGTSNNPLIVLSGPFYCPTGLAFDNQSNLWVVDYSPTVATLFGISKSQLVDGGVVQPISSFQIPLVDYDQPAFNLMPSGLPTAP